MGTTATRRFFLAAPVFLLIGVVVLKFGWKGHAGLDWAVALPVWITAHVGYILGGLAFAVVLAVLWSAARRAARGRYERAGIDVLGVAGVVGTVAMIGQMVIDLIVGFRAGSRAEMSGISRPIHDLPGFQVFFYGFVPALQLAAVALLLGWLAVRRQIAGWPAALFLAGSGCIATQLTYPMVLGGIAVGVALAAVSRQAAETPPRHRRPATEPVSGARS